MFNDKSGIDNLFTTEKWYLIQNKSTNRYTFGIIGQKCVRNHVSRIAIQGFCGNRICFLHIRHPDKKCVKNQFITLIAVRLAAYRMWVISYVLWCSKHVLAEYLTINRQTLLLSQITYCTSNIWPLLSQLADWVINSVVPITVIFSVR